MPDLRTNKSISQRFDTEFNQRPDTALRRWRRRAAWACVVVPLLGILAYEVLGDGSAYWAGPLYESHQTEFEEATEKGKDGCAICHTHTAQPLWRLVTGSRFACSVADEKCETCHKQNQRLGHSSLLIEHEVLNCASCHEEHRGNDLNKVASARCVSCHSSLRTKDDVHNFFTDIPNFAGHPEFAASRFRETPGIAMDEEPGEYHGANARTRLSDGKLYDRTPLHFNHAAHLSREGTLLLDSTPGPNDEQQNIVTSNQLRWKHLECADCHQTDDGKYMKPIKYEQHCATCHPLSYSEKLSGSGLGPLKHVELANVFVEAKARLLDYSQRELQAAKNPPEDDDGPRLPSKHRSQAELAANPAALSQALWPDMRDVIKGGCGHCHMFRPSGEPGTDAAVAIVPPRIPNRWLPHSQFRHDKHSNYTCISCHDPSAAGSEEWPWETNTSPEEERLLDISRSAADILMPSVSICQKCHVSGSRAAWAKASADCTECHTYHRKSTGK